MGNYFRAAREKFFAPPQYPPNQISEFAPVSDIYGLAVIYLYALSLFCSFNKTYY